MYTSTQFCTIEHREKGKTGEERRQEERGELLYLSSAQLNYDTLLLNEVDAEYSTEDQIKPGEL